MKRFILLLLVTAVSNVGYSQSTFSNTGSGLNDISRYMDDEDSTADEGVADDDEEDTETEHTIMTSLEDVAMEATDSTVVFDNLPVKGSVPAHVTNAAGEELYTKAVSSKRPYFGIRRLPKGLYFVTLTYKNQRKAFELHREDDGKKKAEGK